ncbi:MAG: hypothetical protein ABEI57_02975 [Halapricum sp.]
MYDADMIEWEETESGLRVFDRTKTEVSIAAADWEVADAGYEIDRPVDETMSGAASELQFPAALAKAFDLDSGEKHLHGSDASPLELPDGEYLLDLSLNIKTYLRFSGPVTVTKTDDYNELHVTFPDQTRVTFGFRSHHEEPVDTVTVPPTTDGVATAVTYLSSSHKTTGPDRSYPNLRGHPPEVELGDCVDIPDAVREERFDVGIELVVPDEFAYVFVAAPLAYYLQAELSVAERATPVLRAPTAGIEREFSRLPEFQHEAADLLRRVFLLDCLVRNAGEYSWDLSELSLLDEIGLDAEAAYESTPAEQLATYLDVPYERIDGDLPEWHLAMHVDPAPDHASCLPYFLDNLSLIYLPESVELQKDELLNKSIDDFYRDEPTDARAQATTATAGLARSSEGSVSSVDRRDPVLHEGQVNGWLADGVPIDVFTAVPSAYENRSKYVEQGGDDIDVTVILNDEEMVDEHETVADIYEERSQDLPIDVTVHEHLTKAELADVLESSHDFVHYIGHCEEDGLRCTNGNLPVSSVEESDVQTFFLNACGSYYEGRDLVEKGSVAGAVTFTRVLNKQAAKVGVAFARLLIHGFNIDLALRYARRRIMMGKDYAVVGDGTHVLTQTENRFPVLLTLDRSGDGFVLEHEHLSVNTNGSIYHVFFDDHNEYHLQGTKARLHMDKDELLSFLSRAEAPVVYDGELYWSEECRDVLRS